MEGNVSQSFSGALPTNAARAGLAFVLLLIDSTNIIGNLMVFVTVLANHRLQTITNFFIMNLCFADLLAGLVLIPFAVDAVLNETPVARRNGVACDFLGFVDSLYAIGSSLTTAAIAIDRYHAIVNCLHYEAIVTQKRTVMVIAWIWFQASLVSLCPLVGWGKFSFRTNQFGCTLHLPDRDGFIYLQFTSCIIVPYVIIVFCYARIHLVARRQARCILVHIQVQDTRHKVTGISMQKTRLVYVVIGLYTVCWLPLYAIKLSLTISPGTSIPGGLITSATVFSLFNGTCNPLLYALRTSQYRAGMIRWYRRLRRWLAPKRIGQSHGESHWTMSRSRSRSVWNIFQGRLAHELEPTPDVALSVQSINSTFSRSRGGSVGNGDMYPMTLRIPGERPYKEIKKNHLLPPLSNNFTNAHVLPEGENSADEAKLGKMECC